MIDSLLEATFNSNLFDQVAKIRCSIFRIKINITRSVPERKKKSRLIQLLSTVYQQIKKSKKKMTKVEIEFDKTNLPCSSVFHFPF